MRSLRALALGLGLLAALSPGLAGACAALFSPDGNVRQSGQRIIFAVDRAAGTVAATVAVNYVGAAEDFAWIVPMPSNPKVEVADAELFDLLDTATQPRYLFPERSCPELDLSLGVGGAPPEGAAPGGVDVLQQGQVGPYDFAVVGGDNSAELSDWLRGNGYQITPPMEPLIKLYTDERMLFLAMKLQGGREVGDIQPVRMTFPANRPVIPLRLAAVGAERQTELRVWVFDDTQVAPENMQRVVIPDDQVVLTGFSGRSNYDDLVITALGEADGQALVVEHALPTERLSTFGNAELAELAARHRFLTRFYGLVSPEQMRADPSFAPAAGLAPVDSVHDLRGRVSPYDCAAREVIAPADQVAQRGSPRGLWLSYRWLLGGAALLLLAGGGVALLLRRRGRGAA